MYDPYSVLGVSKDATDDEIKKAYRTLSRKYHPDANINNPNKDRAEEKFKEVQQAYQQIMDMREQGTTGNFGDFYGGQQRTAYGGGEEDTYKQAAVNYIRSGHYKEALNVLNSMKQKDARWYYLSAVANSGTGNNLTALEHAKVAVSMEPGNMEYRQLLQQLEGGGSWYDNRRQTYGSSGMGGSGTCGKICLAYMICNLCCGGGGLCCGSGVPLGY